MTRSRARFFMAVAIVAPAYLFVAHAQQAKPANPAQKSNEPMKSDAAKTGVPTKAQKIADAMSAAPPAISRGATIMDWGADPMKDKPTQLRAGTNGWVCYPTMQMPGMPANANSPMCIDKQWQAWAEAYMADWANPPASRGKTGPKVTGTGVAYMLKGDDGASNTDPFAEGPTPANDWVVSPPHIMVLFGDLKMLDAYPTDPKNGGPWVMWKGTPYAHLMVPVSATKGATVTK